VFIVANGEKMNDLYILVDSIMISHVSLASQSMQDETKLWHIWLGHNNEKGLMELEKENPLGGNKMEELEFYDHHI